MVFLYNHSLPALLAALVAIATSTSTSPFVAGQEQITPDTFKAGIESGAYDLVLDVRRQDEWDAGHIPTAVHVPNETFEEDDFWKNMAEEYSCNASCAKIVLYCRSGGRSGEAIEKLKAMGFEGTLLNGMGVSQWTGAGLALTLEEDSVEPVCATTNICAPEPAAADVVEEESAVVEEEPAPAEEKPASAATEENEEPDSVEADMNYASEGTTTTTTTTISAQGRVASLGLFFAVSTLFLIW